MNTLNNTTFVNIVDDISKESIFPDKRELNWDGKNNIFTFLMDVFVELWEKSWERLYVKHMLFQFLLNEYLFQNDLEDFLKDNWFELHHTFYSFDELKYVISKNKWLLLDIKSGRYNMAILFNELIPIWLVLAEKKENDHKIHENINKLRDEINLKISEFTQWKDFII